MGGLQEYRERRNAQSRAHYARHSEERKSKSRAGRRNRMRQAMAPYLLGNMRNSAKRKDYACTISLEELKSLLEPMTCALTGWKLRWDPNYPRDPLAPSPDRIDTSKGYVPGNVRIVCWRVNALRRDMTDEELFEVCEAMLAKRSFSIG